jgi:hypothetical protein
MRVSPALVKPCENVTVTVTLHNTGNRAGSEVAQLCVQIHSISFARPLTYFVSVVTVGRSCDSIFWSRYASFAEVHPMHTASGDGTGSHDSAVARNVSLAERTAEVTLVNFERLFVEAGASVQVVLTVTPRHYAVIQEQPRGPATASEPNGSWVPPVWEMQAVAVTLHVGGQQPTVTPRLPSNVLRGTFVVEGDNSPAARCPKYVPHDGL